MIADEIRIIVITLYKRNLKSFIKEIISWLQVKFSKLNESIGNRKKHTS